MASPSVHPSSTPSIHPSASPSLNPSAVPSLDPTVLFLEIGLGQFYQTGEVIIYQGDGGGLGDGVGDGGGHVDGVEGFRDNNRHCCAPTDLTSHSQLQIMVGLIMVGFTIDKD